MRADLRVKLLGADGSTFVDGLQINSESGMHTCPFPPLHTIHMHKPLPPLQREGNSFPALTASPHAELILVAETLLQLRPLVCKRTV